MVVVLPAPLGPRKPRISPFLTTKEMPSTAVVRPYRLVRLSTSITDRAPIAQESLPLGGRRRGVASLEAAQPGVFGREARSPYHSDGPLAVSTNRCRVAPR